MIARAAEGSVRDSLSILDQAIAHGGGAVTAEAVRAMLGLADRSRIIDLFEHLMKGDVAAALTELRAQYDTGADPAAVLTDLAEFNYLVTRLRFVPEAASDATLSEDERRRGGAFAEKLSVRVLSRTWQMLLKGIPEVQSSNRPVSAAEMVLVRIAHAADLPTLDEALKSLENGGTAAAVLAPEARNGGGFPASGGNGGSGGSAALPQARLSTGGATGQTMRRLEPAPAAEAPPRAERAPDPGPPMPEVRLASLADIAALADANRDMAFKVLLKRCVRLVHIEPGRLDISLTDVAPKTLMGDLTRKLQDWTGRRWVVSLSREEGSATLAEEENARRETALMDARSDPAVAAILERFPGAKIIDVRIPDAPEAVVEEADMSPEPVGEDDEVN